MRRALLALLAATALACRSEPLHEYPEDVVDNFLAACRANGAPEDACQCSLDGLRKRFTADEYMALEKKVQARDEAATRLLGEVAEDCRD